MLHYLTPHEKRSSLRDSLPPLVMLTQESALTDPDWITRTHTGCAFIGEPQILCKTQHEAWTINETVNKCINYTYICNILFKARKMQLKLFLLHYNQLWIPYNTLLPLILNYNNFLLIWYAMHMHVMHLCKAIWICLCIICEF